MMKIKVIIIKLKKGRFSHKLEAKSNKLKRKHGMPLLSNVSNDDLTFNHSHRVLTESEKSVLARVIAVL